MEQKQQEEEEEMPEGEDPYWEEPFVDGTRAPSDRPRPARDIKDH